MATSVGELLNRPDLERSITVISVGARGQTVHRVLLLEDAHELRQAHPGDFIVLTRRASASLRAHELDVLLRVAVQRGVAALALALPTAIEDVPRSSRSIAEHSAVTLCIIRAGVSPSHILLDLHDGVNDGVLVSLAEAAETHRRVHSYRNGDDPVRELAALVREGLGIGIDVRDAPGEVDIVADGVHVASYSIPGTDRLDAAHALHRLVLTDTAARAARLLEDRSRASERPIATRAMLLAELLTGGSEDRPEVVSRARTMSMPIEGWHTVVRFEHVDPKRREQDPTVAFEMTAEISRLALVSAQESPGAWYRTELGDAIILLRIDRTPPEPTQARDMIAAVDRIIQRLRSTLPEVSFYCGVGGTLQGLEGLRASAGEARASAMAARAAQRENHAVLYSRLGIQRSLLQWYAMPNTQALVARVLAPLDALGPNQQRVLFRSLQAYLDHPASTADAAAALGIHRNTLNNRIKRIADLLDIDFSDADHRLILQLACRMKRL